MQVKAFRRSTRRSVATALLLLAAGVNGLGGLAGCAEAPAQSLLLISIDALRPDKLGAYGFVRPTSPVIDAFAQQGMRVTGVLSPAPSSLPAHASLLTGLYPVRHGVRSEALELPDEVATLAEQLAASGFRTAGIVNSASLAERHGLSRGFEEFEWVPEEPARTEPSAVLRKALDWLGREPVDANERFFLFLHFADLEADYRALPAFEDALMRPYEGVIDGSAEQLRRIQRGELRLELLDVRNLLDRYSAGILQMDDGVRQILRKLAVRDPDGRTLVILTSGHGEEFMDHGGVLHGRTLFEEVLRVPLILRGPRVPAGGVALGTASLVDVAPTALSLLGVPPAEGLDGIDLSRRWDGGMLPERAVFAELDRRPDTPDSRSAVRRGHWKLELDPATGAAALYDLSGGGVEGADVAADLPQLTAELRAELERHAAQAPRGTSQALAPPESAGAVSSCPPGAPGTLPAASPAGPGAAPAGADAGPDPNSGAL